VGVNPVDPPGALRRLGRRKLKFGSLEEGRRRGSILVGPQKPAGVAGKPASSRDGVCHCGELVAAEWWGRPKGWEHQSRVVRTDAPLRHQRGQGDGGKLAALRTRRPQSHMPA
jgi:hypothetical protein